ncbi:MAG: iron-sulfur cluster insertion protein ErpA [Myxococcales bacterium]|nr:iron-sulfur cluster insertion protein ErpA [Myxococcales bacterium]
MIGLSENAAQKVLELIDNRPNPTTGLRVGVRGGGCSGFTYFLEFAEAPNKGDRELESHGVPLFVDPKSYLYLMGTEVDYVDNLGQSGFKFTNPNARRTCGCGESFSV